MGTRDKDLDVMTEAELLALPDSLIPCGSLTKFWSLHAGVLQKENADELIRERTGVSRSHRMIGAAETPEEIEQRAQRRREEWAREFAHREEILLQRLAEQEQRIEQQREEIDRRAIRLQDGRHAYVDGEDYRDEQGRKLQGRDRDEAAGKRQGTSATWDEKRENQKQYDEAERLRREIEANKAQPPADRERSLTVYEHQFTEDFGRDKAKIENGTADYSADFSDLKAQPDQTIAQIVPNEAIPETAIAPPQSRGVAPKV